MSAFQDGEVLVLFGSKHVTLVRKGMTELWHVVRPIEAEQRVLHGDKGYLAEVRAFADTLESVSLMIMSADEEKRLPAQSETTP